MSKYKFNNDERYSVWKILGPNCQWCKEPVMYKDCHIDHIVPESLLEDPSGLKAVLEKYGLNKDFNINGFENWIPSHPSCNQSKSDSVISGTPVIQQLLENVNLKVEATEKLYKKWKNQDKTAKLESLITKALDDGIINKQTVNNIFLKIDDSVSPIMGMTASTASNQVVYLPTTDNWTVVKSDGEFITVTKSGKTGILPVGDSPDPKWLCLNCKHYGPWSGNECLNCGETSFE